VGLIAVGTAVIAPPVLSTVDDLRTAGAVRYLSGELQRARLEAVARSADTAVRFTRDDGSYAYRIFVDRNRNGVRATDIDAGVDIAMGHAARLGDHFSGVEFGALPGLPAIDPDGTPPGDDPIRFGVSDTLTFTPRGTASSGSAYILGRRGTQYAIRVYGETGKTRVLRFDARRRAWRAL
jgi:hypothetical protein